MLPHNIYQSQECSSVYDVQWCLLNTHKINILLFAVCAAVCLTVFVASGLLSVLLRCVARTTVCCLWSHPPPPPPTRCLHVWGTCTFRECSSQKAITLGIKSFYLVCSHSRCLGSYFHVLCLGPLAEGPIAQIGPFWPPVSDWIQGQSSVLQYQLST